MNFALLAKLGVDTSAYQTGLNKAERHTQKASSRMLTSFKKMHVGFGKFLAVTGATALGKKLYDLGTAAESSAKKFESVFGSRAGSMDKQLAKLRDVIPGTTAELRGMAAEIQDLLVPLGVGGAEAEKMTVHMMKLAADLAVFNGIGADEALDTIRAGLVGSYEPLLKFGVALNTGTVKAEAFAMGIGDGKRELTAAERAMVSYQLIVEGTSKAHGEAERQVTDAAAQVRLMVRDIREYGQSLGKDLLPVVKEVIRYTRIMTDGMREGSAAVETALKRWNQMTGKNKSSGQSGYQGPLIALPADMMEGEVKMLDKILAKSDERSKRVAKDLQAYGLTLKQIRQIADHEGDRVKLFYELIDAKQESADLDTEAKGTADKTSNIVTHMQTTAKQILELFKSQNTETAATADNLERANKAIEEAESAGAKKARDAQSRKFPDRPRKGETAIERAFGGEGVERNESAIDGAFGSGSYAKGGSTAGEQQKDRFDRLAEDQARRFDYINERSSDKGPMIGKNFEGGPGAGIAEKIGSQLPEVAKILKRIEQAAQGKFISQ